MEALRRRRGGRTRRGQRLPQAMSPASEATVTHPCDEGLDHGQAVAFVLRRQHRRISMAVEGKQRLVVERRQPEDALAEVWMAGQRRQRVVSHPAFAADNDEASILGLETVEGRKQNRVVLARLDGPDREEEAQSGESSGKMPAKWSPSSALPAGRNQRRA